MTDLNKERELYMAAKARIEKEEFFCRDWDLWKACAELKQAEINELRAELEKAKAKAVPEGYVLVEKKNTEDWYLDEDEGMWFDHDGIDNSLCDLDAGQVQTIKHKEYLITESNTLFASKVWDEANEQIGFWEFFKTKEEAEEAATHCKAMIKASESGAEG
ncbi:hypothetical protein ABTE01_03600 [Acinetobacter baumannii]|uniref:hypothetical protein n=1 Tax=Acinetobacter baumannii TaxID=470 RepID=UPI0036F479BB